MENIERYNQILLELNKFYKEEEKTIFEITKYPYRELVSSNMLAFYFDVNEVHGLKDLLLRALIMCINEKINDIKIENNIEINEIKVRREYPTLENNSIDLVLYNDEFVIAIENKLYASLYNDLNDYGKTIDNINENNYKVVLSIRNENVELGFINILYKNFFNKVKELLKGRIDKNNKWHIFLEDFIETILKAEEKTIMDENMINWYMDKKDDIEKLLKALKKMKNDLNYKVDELGEILDSNINRFGYKTGRYNYNKIEDLSSICNIKIRRVESDNQVTIDNKLTFEGWEININTGIKNQNNVIEILKKYNIDSKKLGNEHLRICEFDKDVEYSKLVDKNIELIEIFIESN